MIISAISGCPVNSINFKCFRKKKYNPNEILPNGMTRGEYDMKIREEQERERAFQREIMLKSDNEYIRAYAKKVGEDPELDKIIVWSEFEKQRIAKEKAKRDAESAESVK